MTTTNEQNEVEIENEQTASPVKDWVVIMIGNNHGWGIGKDLEEARKFAGRPTGWVAYLAHPDTTVSSFDGSLAWTRGYAPKLISTKGVKQAKARKGVR